MNSTDDSYKRRYGLWISLVSILGVAIVFIIAQNLSDRKDKEYALYKFENNDLQSYLYNEDWLSKSGALQDYDKVVQAVEKKYLADLRKERERKMRELALKKEQERKKKLEEQRKAELALAEKKKKEQKRAEFLAKQKERKKSEPKSLASRSNEYKGSWNKTEATHYSLGNTGGDVPACGVINLQQTGTHYQGMRIVAANTSLYPCGSVLEIKSKLGVEKAIVMDTGGFLKSKPRNIDILVRTEKEAYALGRYQIDFRVLRKGW